ncbi:LysR family transcriptional regulator [Azorhizobium oxalatiphilum]|uniref:LysR family transcriptional regulator n=1 Tax=Azorhizobium oxalatiphilum TaxID=980631 RepID=A0A917BI92_9HYPH|nr:LysR family transcriptional regulator [Azorhizobium oxalatiphilum]GGF46560.1 LysR family transcriptional regulator [Azorhizobium oxalatiphilum]
MRHRFLPPIPTLTAFEAAARHQNFSRAAEELHLTQGAVSRQIRHLEEQVGIELFERVRQKVVLTDGGRLYLADVRQVLQALSEATQRAMTYGGGAGSLQLAVLPTFAIRWLMPRLPDFLDRFPDTTVNFVTRIAPFDFEAEPLDVAIHYGDPVWPGAICEHLMDEEVVPVCSPALRDRHGLTTPDRLGNVPLLQQSTRPHLWTEWLEMTGASHPAPFKGPRFEQFTMIAEAASAGLGIGLVPRFLALDEIADGRLVELFGKPMTSDKAYYVVYPETKAGVGAITAFVRWIVAAARTDSAVSSKA